MTYKNITLNCLIIFIGKLINILYIKIIQVIIIYNYESASKIEAIIQSKLKIPFNNIPLKICIIQAKSIIKKEMDMYNEIFEFFTEISKAKHFYITIYFKLE